MLPRPASTAKQGSGTETSHQIMLLAWLMEPKHVEVWSSERAISQANEKHGVNATWITKS
ncbi:hypothetical protein FOCG_01912 [Fusarium oxysporum f. sp. radicis-lycopersici 26381]|nr:hypothetical protein FOWG_00105 [Fusarium oxysporum f. sp. lycopersici MN25]EXL58371.1 hypothetical protein FOCG_01912 [Fusarium oxysporum f. sp. radicis-lycopersici 26381]